ADYYVFVSRAPERPLCGVWDFTLRDRLPEIPVPLAAGDTDLPLQLQDVFDAVYDTAGYSDTVDYEHGATPPLRPEDQAWADALVGEQMSRRRTGDET